MRDARTPASQGIRAAWSVTVNRTFPGACNTKPPRPHRRDEITPHYTAGSLKKKKGMNKPCGGVAVDQNPIKHCLALNKLPVLAC